MAAEPYARPIQPWLDITAFPDSMARALGISLSLAVFAFGVLRPIQCEAVAHEPFAKICAANRTGRYRAAIWVEAQWKAIDREPVDKGVKVICRLRAAAVLGAILTTAYLAALRCIDPPEADPRPMNFEGVAAMTLACPTKSSAKAALESNNSASTARIRRISSTLAQAVTADCAD